MQSYPSTTQEHPRGALGLLVPGLRVVARALLAHLVILALALSGCSSGVEAEPLEVVSVEAFTRSPQLMVRVAHRSCGVEPSVLVDQGSADVILSAEMRARECNDIRVESDLLIDMDDQLGDRTLVVRSAGGDPTCLIDGEASLRCTAFFPEGR